MDVVFPENGILTPVMDLVIIRTTGYRYTYNDLRIEAEYEHKLICSDVINTIDEAVAFMKEHNCQLNDFDHQQLNTIIQQNAASCIIHIDIASDVVYAKMYTILDEHT
jgi:pantothenate kinase-related protein Tda10